MKRPYIFTAEWVRVSEEELRTTRLAQFYYNRDNRERCEVWKCVTENGTGVLDLLDDDSWYGGLMDNSNELRFYWTTTYRHRHEKLDRAKAQDLVEAALVGASIFGLDAVGTPHCCP